MRTALFLLLLLALAAVPGSLVPQRSSDPNGVSLLFTQDPERARFYDSLQLFDVYTSPWFSAVYLLLFISLVGCVIPRIRHHAKALLSRPPATPANLHRLPAHRVERLEGATVTATLELLERELRRERYRTIVCTDASGRRSIAAEKGYLRETGNLLFHISLIGVLMTVAVGGGYKYTGQRVVVEGQTFVNSQLAYDSFNPGRFVNDDTLAPFSLGLRKLQVDYVQGNKNAVGMVSDYTATVQVRQPSGMSATDTIKVNQPLSVDGNDIYLLGNGYAPQVTVKNPDGKVVFQDSVPFLPQDANLTSLGVIKVPDGLAQQVGMTGFLYPTAATGNTGASYSAYPALVNPIVSLNVFVGDLGLDSGVPRSVYSLDTSKLRQVAGPPTKTHSLTLIPGKPVALPRGLGTVELGKIPRFASFEIAHDPTQIPVLLFAILVLTSLALALYIPRRRVWARVDEAPDGVRVELAALARGEDPRLDKALTQISETLHRRKP